MAMKYLKLYSTFPSPFLGWLPSPLSHCCVVMPPAQSTIAPLLLFAYATGRVEGRRDEGNVNCCYSPRTMTTLCVLNLLKPSGYYIYTTRFDIHKFHVLPTQCIYVFCVDLRTNSDYFPIQH